jgi:hypothetical protein
VDGTGQFEGGRGKGSYQGGGGRRGWNFVVGAAAGGGHDAGLEEDFAVVERGP